MNDFWIQLAFLGAFLGIFIAAWSHRIVPFLEDAVLLVVFIALALVGAGRED